MRSISRLCSLDGLLQSILSTFPQHRRSTYPHFPPRSKAGCFYPSSFVRCQRCELCFQLAVGQIWHTGSKLSCRRCIAKHREPGVVGFSQLSTQKKPRISMDQRDQKYKKYQKISKNVEMTRTCELFRPKRSRTTIHRKLNRFRSNQKKLSSSMSR